MTQKDRDYYMTVNIWEGFFPRPQEILVSQLSFDKIHKMIKIGNRFFEIDIQGEQGNVPQFIDYDTYSEPVLMCSYGGRIAENRDELDNWFFGDIVLIPANPFKRDYNNGYYNYL